MCGPRDTRHETRIAAFPESRPLRFIGRQTILPGANRAPAKGFHESRVTSHESRPLPTAARNCPLLPGFFPRSHGCPRLPVIARNFPAFLPPRHGITAHDGPLWPAVCPRWPTIARYCPAFLLPQSKGPRTVCRSRSASRRESFAAAPVAPGLLPPLPTPNEPTLRKGNVLFCIDTFLSRLDTDQETALTPTGRFGILAMQAASA